jgi:hypothetical protein
MKVLTTALTVFTLTAGSAFAICGGKMADPRVDGPQTTAETPIVVPGQVGS